MNLFQSGPVMLASGELSGFKIECDALSPRDWGCLAFMAVSLLPDFGEVVGVPRGGDMFAKALSMWITKGPRLVCDDVFTTGASIAKYMGEGDLGVVAFARNPPPPTIVPVFLYGAYSAKKLLEVE